MMELKLQGMYQRLDRVLEQRSADSGFIESLEELLQSESDYRDHRQTERMMKLSRLSHKPQVEDFDWTAKRSLSKSQIKDLYELGWIQNKRSILIIGATGVGKTFLAQALGTHCCAHRISTLFLDMSRYLEELAIARSTNSYLKYLNKLAKPQLVIIDDFGLRKLSTDQANDMCDLLKMRIGKSIIITTQLPIKHWQEVIEDPVIADTIIDRLAHTSIILDYEGPTYREVQAKKIEDKERTR